MLKCLQCSRVGDDIGMCGSPITCPKQGRPVDPKTDIVIRCDLCDITRAVPVGTLTKHQDPRLDNACQSETCKAYVLQVKPEKAPPPAKTSPAAAGGPASGAPLDPADDAPVLTEEQLNRAAIMDGDKVVRPATGTLTQDTPKKD